MRQFPLSNRLALIFTHRFPRRFRSGREAHRAVVGIGGNVGNVAQRFDRVVDYMRRSGRVRVVETSPLLKNPPFGYLDQPDFLNAVLVLRTAMGPFETLRWLLWVEKRFGRRRTFPNAPRTLDLDIIFFDQLQLRTQRLHVPHPDYRERLSVMIPLRMVKERFR